MNKKYFTIDWTYAHMLCPVCRRAVKFYLKQYEAHCKYCDWIVWAVRWKEIDKTIQYTMNDKLIKK